MLTVGDKNYRNLQEQVLKNQYDIEHLKELGINADLGIRVVNAETPLASASDLPENYTGEYGDAYIVGTAAPFTLYVWSRTSVEGVGFWFDWGELNAPSVVPGPIGPQGIQGETGQRGSFWYSQTGAPTITQGVNNNDQALDGSTGNVYQFVNGAWQLTGNIRGPQGIQGIQGLTGATGPQGPQGIQGQKGDQGQFIKIIGTLDNVNQLPEPSSVPRSSAYLIPDVTLSEHVWLLVGEGTTESPLLWHDAGGFGGGTTVTINGVQQSSIDLGNDIAVPNYSIGDNTVADIDAAGVHFLGLEASGKNPAGSNAATQEADIALPIADSSQIKRVIDANDKVAFELTQSYLDQVEAQIAAATPPEVKINAPTTSTNGQLTADQLATLQANKGAYLFFNNEIFRLEDTQHISGYLIYVHCGYENTTNTYKIKCITITISTRGWVLTERVVADPNNYYTKSQADNRYLQRFGGTMHGDITNLSSANGLTVKSGPINVTNTNRFINAYSDTHYQSITFRTQSGDPNYLLEEWEGSESRLYWVCRRNSDDVNVGVFYLPEFNGAKTLATTDQIPAAPTTFASGKAGLVPAPTSTQYSADYYLKGNGKFGQLIMSLSGTTLTIIKS